ncbi:hypothetical protein GQ53DRAFT_792713 [Thozetella sp. PMI_491]|nr:hypothetical protein GQ53DRAFT_792713 [Thozetella sp. PMI_491]
MSSTGASASGAGAILPSGEPAPSSSPIPPRKPAPLPSIPLRTLLAAVPPHTDAFLTHLHRCMSTPSGIDTVLLFVGYTSRLAAVGLTSLSANALRRSAREWIALVAALPPRATILFTSDESAKLPSTAAAAAALVLAQRLRALATLLADVRTAMRLWGLLSMYLWGRRLVLKHLAARKAKATEKGTEPQETAAETALAWAQFLSCTAYQVLENGAYLASKGVLGWAPATQGRASRWSVRCWALFVGLELGRLVAEGLGDGKDGRIKKTAVEVETWRKNLVRNLAWAPLTVHWSLEKGFASETAIAMLGSVPGMIQMRDLWRSTA